jgi:hypothetical protein
MGKQNIDNASNSKKYTFRSLFIKIIQISDERRLKNTTMIMTEKLNLKDDQIYAKKKLL